MVMAKAAMAAMMAMLYPENVRGGGGLDVPEKRSEQQNGFFPCSSRWW